MMYGQKITFQLFPSLSLILRKIHLIEYLYQTVPTPLETTVTTVIAAP